MNLIEIEKAARHAWPALEEEELPFGVLRFAHGVSRRANSFNPYADAVFEPQQLLRLTERFFSGHRQPSIVRIIEAEGLTTPRFAELDACLAAQDYELVTPTRVMMRTLVPGVSAVAANPAGSARAVDLGVWLQCWHELTARSPQQLQIHRDMLARLRLPHRLLALAAESGPWTSCGMAVKSGKLLGIFGIATAPAARGRGLATSLVQQLLDWGFNNDCDTAYLQVECANAPANAVYGKLGFTEAYRYWYREKQLIHFNPLEAGR